MSSFPLGFKSKLIHKKHARLLAKVSDDFVLALVLDESSKSHLNVLRFASKSPSILDPKHKELVPFTQCDSLPDAPFLLEVNNDFSKALVCGRTGAVIVDLPEISTLFRFFSKSSERSLSVSVVSVDEDFYDANPTVSIACAHWHPISAEHLGMVHSDGCFRLFSTIRPERVEQIVPLRDESGSRFPVVEFCFADSSSDGWSLFSVYLVSSRNEFYVLSPLVPSGCLYPERVFMDLISRAQNRLDDLSLSISSRERAALLRQVAFLSQCCTDVKDSSGNVTTSVGYGIAQDAIVAAKLSISGDLPSGFCDLVHISANSVHASPIAEDEILTNLEFIVLVSPNSVCVSMLEDSGIPYLDSDYAAVPLEIVDVDNGCTGFVHLECDVRDRLTLHYATERLIGTLFLASIRDFCVSSDSEVGKITPSQASFYGFVDKAEEQICSFLTLHPKRAVNEGYGGCAIAFVESRKQAPGNKTLSLRSTLIGEIFSVRFPSLFRRDRVEGSQLGEAASLEDQLRKLSQFRVKGAKPTNTKADVASYLLDTAEEMRKQHVIGGDQVVKLLNRHVERLEKISLSQVKDGDRLMRDSIEKSGNFDKLRDKIREAEVAQLSYNQRVKRVLERIVMCQGSLSRGELEFKSFVEDASTRMSDLQEKISQIGSVVDSFDRVESVNEGNDVGNNSPIEKRRASGLHSLLTKQKDYLASLEHRVDKLAGIVEKLELQTGITSLSIS